MLRDEAQLIYMTTGAGRHWLRTLGHLPLQLAPVAANQRRVAAFLLTVIHDRLRAGQVGANGILQLDRLTPQVLHAAGWEAHDAPDVAPMPIRLVSEPAAARSEEQSVDERWLTPRPLPDWQADYDRWLVELAHQLGATVPAPATDDTYSAARQAASTRARERLAGVRQRYLQGEWTRVLLKARLADSETDLGVWLRVTDWRHAEWVSGVIASEPYVSADYWLGQLVTLPAGAILDFCVGADASPVEQGFTVRVDQDYGLEHRRAPAWSPGQDSA